MFGCFVLYLCLFVLFRFDLFLKFLEFLSLGALVPKTLTFRKRLRAKPLM